MGSSLDELREGDGHHAPHEPGARPAHQPFGASAFLGVALAVEAFWLAALAYGIFRLLG